jgi:hypothetical protein
VLYDSLYLYLLADCAYINFNGREPILDGHFHLRSCPDYCELAQLSSSAINFNFCHQGMYPAMIIVVVTMQLSTADIVSCSGADARRDSPIVFTPPSPVLPQIVGDVQTSPDGRFIAVSSDAMSTGAVTLSIP